MRGYPDGSQFIESAATRRGVTAAMVREHGKGCRAVTDARMDAACAMKARDWSLTRIGAALGGKDHASVRNLLLRAEARREKLLRPDFSGEWAI